MHDCKHNIVPAQVKNYRTLWHGQQYTIPDAKVNQCTVCNATYVPSLELHRWKNTYFLRSNSTWFTKFCQVILIIFGLFSTIIFGLITLVFALLMLLLASGLWHVFTV